VRGVVVIGAGQAGLSVSYELTRAGVEHVVLERARIGETWRNRWDSFCLVTPNWNLQLPGHHYAGDDPDGFLPRDEVVEYLEAYADAYAAPVRTGVEVRSLERQNGGFVLETTDGPIDAQSVVVATGAYQRSHRPPGAAAMPAEVFQLDADAYQNPDALPPNPVLVVGSGQTGCQLAEELFQSGRTVFLSCGRAPWAPRRISGRDLVWWAVETGFVDMHVSALPHPSERLVANVLSTGKDGGRDLHLRVLHRLGVNLVGHLVAVEGRRARFADDLSATVAWGDERYGRFAGLIRNLAAERGMPEPELPDPEPFQADAREELDLTGFGAVIFAGGYRPAYGDWIPCPGAFDEHGFPVQVDGASTVVDGLFFAGVHFLRKRKSSIFVGVGEDAAIVADAVAARSRRAPAPA
jgi:Pyridine nucleotide-disulphide oxidoreductase